MPFIKYDRLSRSVYRVKDLSKIFHNWFYAGWVVVDNDWANIPPQTVRGAWEPIVSTEEFETGLSILAKRNHMPQPQKRHFYLLQGLLYLEPNQGKLIKLTCSKPNSKRPTGGTPYYCVPSSNFNYSCGSIDEQIPLHIQRVQISPEVLPKIRRAYQADVTHYTTYQNREDKQLKAALQKVETKELNLWRAFTEYGMQASTYQKPAQEYQEEKQRIEFALQAIKQENREYIATLDVALEIIVQIGERYLQQDSRKQREILRQIVSKVVIDKAGTVVRLELHSPFTYLHSLNTGNNGSGNGQQLQAKGRRKKTSGGNQTDGSSLQVSLGSPNGSPHLS